MAALTIGTGMPQHGLPSIQLLVGMWDTLAMQLTPFNTSKVIALPTSMYAALDDHAKQYFLERMQQHTGLQAILVRDGTDFARYLLGPVQEFLQIPNGNLIQINGQDVFVIHNDNSELELAVAPSMPTQPATDHDVPGPRIPRPPNAYILYRKDNHHIVKDANPGIHNNEISVILGSQWNNESMEVRAEYAAKAEAVKEEFMKLYPNYKYNPRRPEQKKRRTKRQAALAQGTAIPIGEIQEEELQLIEEEHQAVNMYTPQSIEAAIALAEQTAMLHGDDIDEFNRELEEYYNTPSMQF